MNKPIDYRGQGSIENKKSDQNPHLSDEQLLLDLDGELSAHEAGQVEAHIQSCWSCRARRDQIEKAIGNVVEYRDHLVRPYFPIPTGWRSQFLGRLEQLTVNVDRLPLWKRILKTPRILKAISHIVVPRYVWTGALVIGISSLFLFTHFLQAPKVSAGELLENARGFEVRATQSVAKPVVYQKLSIRAGSETVTRTIYRDPVGKRQVDRIEVVEGARDKSPSNAGLQRRPLDKPNAVPTAEAELRQIFFTANLSWEDPLSPTNYSTWYHSLDEKSDEMSTGDEKFVVLKTTTSEGPIAEGRITVRASDFHLIEEDLRLQDGRLVELHELAWDVLPMDAIDVSIFEPEPMLFAPVNKLPTNVALQPPVVTDSELAEAELRARVALHTEKADLGEQIDLDRDQLSSGQRSVVVRGIVNTLERKRELLAAIQGIPHVEVRLQTTEEAQSQQVQVPADKSQSAVSQNAQAAMIQEYGNAAGTGEGIGRDMQNSLNTGREAFERRLEERFPIAKDRTTFVNETVEIVQDAMTQAWALRRLTNRYTPDAVEELSSGSQQTLELLIRDHVSELCLDVDEVRSRVSPFLSPTFVASAPPSESDTPVTTGTVASDWRDIVLTVFSEIQKVNDDGGNLLAGSNQNPFDPQSAVRELQEALTGLKTQLPALYQQVRGPFLNAPTSSEN
jgi:hypothetical protein